MNIILNKIFYIIITFFTLSYFSHSNPGVQDTTFKLIIELSTGYTACIDSTIFDGGINPNLRLMWEPDRKLNIGIETSYMLIEKHSIEEKKYDDGKTSFDVSLKAIPLLLIFNMEILKTDFYTGIGASYVWTELDAFNVDVNSPVWNYTLMFGLGYTYLLTNNLGIGIEAKSYLLTRMNKEIASFQIKFKWKLYEW
jgi:hypothetical protein